MTGKKFMRRWRLAWMNLLCVPFGIQRHIDSRDLRSLVAPTYNNTFALHCRIRSSLLGDRIESRKRSGLTLHEPHRGNDGKSTHCIRTARHIGCINSFFPLHFALGNDSESPNNIKYSAFSALRSTYSSSSASTKAGAQVVVPEQSQDIR